MGFHHPLCTDTEVDCYSMHRSRFRQWCTVLFGAVLATGLFRIVLVLMYLQGLLTHEDLPRGLGLMAYYLFFVAIIWIGQRPISQLDHSAS